MINNKRGLELSFTWLFALIVGAVIIFLAIYLSVRIIDTSNYETNTEIAKELTIIFDPLETGLAETKTGVARFDDEIRLRNYCSVEGSFGRQSFSVSTKKSFKGEWGDYGTETRITNKYIYSNSVEEGKEYHFFIKPFETAYKVSDIIILYTKDYCFLKAPEFIIEDLNISINTESEKKIIFVERFADCKNTEEEKIICFGKEFENNEECQSIIIPETTGVGIGRTNDYEIGKTIKEDGTELNFIGNLIYGTIFAEKEIYECNMRRMMLRMSHLANLYLSQSQYLSGKVCDSGITTKLSLLSDSALEIAKEENNPNPQGVQIIAKTINPIGKCELW